MSGSVPLRVAVCDDHEDFRRLLDATIRADPDLELVATAPGVDQLLDALAAVEVDVVLLDWLMPGAREAEGVALVREALPAATVIVLSAVARGAAEDRARAAGADGYVEKGPGARELVAACKAVIATPGD